MSREVANLIVGADDSNHAGTSKGEIIAACFSEFIGDSIVQDFPNIRDYGEVQRWLDSGREYLFGILATEKYRHSHSNLVYAIPYLIKSYLEEKDISVVTLKIYLDGRMDSGVRKLLREEFYGRRGIEKVVVDNFIKEHKILNGRISKHPRCPKVVYCADVIANQLNSEAISEILSHKNLIFIK